MGITIENHPEDRSVLATTLTFTLDAKVLDRNQVLLLVTEHGPNSGVGAAKSDIQADRVVILKDLIDGTRGYRLLSQTAFKVTLTSAATTKTVRRTPSDIAGNLGAIPDVKNMELSDLFLIFMEPRHSVSVQVIVDFTIKR